MKSKYLDLNFKRQNCRLKISILIVLLAGALSLSAFLFLRYTNTLKEARILTETYIKPCGYVVKDQKAFMLVKYKDTSLIIRNGAYLAKGIYVASISPNSLVIKGKYLRRTINW